MRRVLWGLLFFSILCGTFGAWKRHRMERANRHVEIAMDFDDFQQLCDQEGLNADAALLQFRRAGVTSIALTEMTLDKLHRRGDLLWIRGEDLPLYGKKIGAAQPFPFPFVALFVKSPRVREQLEKAFHALLRPPLYKEIPGGFLVKGKWEDISDFGLGIWPGQVSELERLGFLIDPRLENSADTDVVKIDFLLHSIPNDPKISTVIFSGLRNEVLGYDHAIDRTADYMRTTGLRFGYIEAYDPGHVQKGSTELAVAIPDQLVKVQASTSPALVRIDPEADVASFSLGVRERNVRIVYFRPYLMNYGGMDALQTNLDFLDNLVGSLTRGGFKLGKADTFPRYFPGRLTVIVGSIGVAAAFFIGYLLFVDISAFQVAVAFVLIVMITALFTFTHRESYWLSVLGFAAAVIFPTLAVILFSFKKPVTFLKSCEGLVLGVLLTVGGGFIVSSLLAGDLTMLGVEEFRGVKGVLVLPVLFGAWLAWLYRTQEKPAGSLRGALTRFFRPLSDPARLAHLGALIVLAAAGGIMVLRSGNTAQTMVPGWEKTARVMLETVFRARPRFKEFAVGYPFFLLSGLFGIESGWGFLCLLGGSLGFADVMDSFAHLHTPLRYTLLRTFHALWIGVVVGAILVWIAEKLFHSGKESHE